MSPNVFYTALAFAQLMPIYNLSNGTASSTKDEPAFTRSPAYALGKSCRMVS
jgi:hypothetical protein